MQALQAFFELIKVNIDKLILLSLLIFFTCLAMHILHDTPDNSHAWDWIVGLVGEVLGALLLLITGNRYRKEGEAAPAPKTEPQIKA